jgi:uncharacterized protein
MVAQLLKEKLPEVIQTLKTHRVRKAYAFGSVCTDKFNSKSDIDLLIDFDTKEVSGYAENFWQLEKKLKTILNREVDLLPTHTLRNPHFIDKIEETKILLYE